MKRIEFLLSCASFLVLPHKKEDIELSFGYCEFTGDKFPILNLAANESGKVWIQNGSRNSCTGKRISPVFDSLNELHQWERKNFPCHQPGKVAGMESNIELVLKKWWDNYFSQLTPCPI